MRLPVYIGLVATAAGLLLVQGLAALQTWPSPEELARLAVLLLLTFGAAHLRFLLRAGWMTSATTVPHIAAALLLPPGLAAVIGLLTRLSNPRPFVPRKFIFNTANTTLAVVAAAHVAGFVVPNRRLDDWTGLAAALLASLVYHFLQVPLVATAVALDSGKPIRGMALEVVSPEQLTEIGLGLVGGALALMVSLAPVWAAGLILPGLVVFRGKQAMDRAQRQSRDLALTSGVGRAVAGVLRPDLAFEAIAAGEVREALKLDGLALVPLGSEPPAFAEHVAATVDQPAVRTALARQVALQGRRVEVHGNGRGLSAVALPFGVGERTPIGALVAWRGSALTRRHPFTTEELLVLETLADYAAVALETARLAGKMAELSREAAQAEAQRQAEALQQEALRQSEERFRSLVQNASDVIAILDADAMIGYVSPAALQVWGYDPDELRGAQALSLVHPDDLEAAGNHLAQVLSQPGEDVSIELRLRHADGSWRDFDMLATNLLDQPAVAGIVATYRDITQRKAFERELSRLAFRDALTDLPNRALFMDRLERALARADRAMRRVGVLFLDLDNFKVINDSLGHDMGDALLVEVAGRLRRCLRAEDTAARLGGDEFTVLLEDLTTEAEPEEVAERIAAALREPVQLGGRDVFVTASIGLALSRPRIDRPESLLRNADLAMYRAKAGGKACWEVFEPSMETRALERLELETDLRHALARGEFRVHYQPVVELETGRVAELEALVRWERPGHGLVAPLAFIPVAEDTGFIVDIGQWVLEQACQQARAWQERYPGEAALVMCVNLSARQFQHPTLVDDIQHAIAAASIDPRTLKLEITESVIMQDGETAVAKLQALKELGVQLAIDDFGTGYSSLSYLKRFPVDTLKVDRSFVDGLGQDAQDTAIVRSVIALAKTLNMSVTGEGVETPPQQAHLRDLGCDLGQGYLFARPLPAEELEALLDEELPGEPAMPRAA